MTHLGLLPQLLAFSQNTLLHPPEAQVHRSRKLTLGDYTEGTEALILGSPLLLSSTASTAVMKHCQKQTWEERVYLILQVIICVSGEPRQELKQRR